MTQGNSKISLRNDCLAGQPKNNKKLQILLSTLIARVGITGKAAGVLYDCRARKIQ